MSELALAIAGRTANLPPAALPRRLNGRRLPATVGPAFVASVADLDPGNFAIKLQAGAQHGYQLLRVVVLAHLVAMLFQALSARLGIVTGRNLAELCRELLPGPLAVAIIGATLMPHAIFLHSGLTQARILPRDDNDRARLIRAANREVLLALGLAGLISVAMVMLAARCSTTASTMAWRKSTPPAVPSACCWDPPPPVGSLTGRRDVMGAFGSRRPVAIAVAAAAGLVLLLNGVLVLQGFGRSLPLGGA